MHTGQRALGLDLSIVVPVYRSEDCLEALIAAIAKALEPTGRSYEVVLVNDCSPDNSWAVIEAICQRKANVVGVDLRRNFGQDNAIITGLRLARGRYVAIMDDDLQNDPNDLPALVDRIEEGPDAVYADFRVKRQKLWKNLGSWFNGKLAEWVISKPRDIYMSPYKILRKEVVEAICRYEGPDPYIDGLLFQVTSRIAQIPAEHHPRYAGSSTYTFWKSVKVWARLAFSFSARPMRLVSWCGFLFAMLGLLLAFVVVMYRLLFPESFPENAVGWTSLMVALLVLSGVQMFCFGIVGEYTGRTFLRVNNKPQTAIREVLNRSASKELIPAGTERIDAEHALRTETR
ncbi:MAG TPA: glycosyltransferase family 2 protein [Blastocatellia bacterium]|nr:glycosyltransferase family 2 protein [Blastocatellia bacterium]